MSRAIQDVVDQFDYEMYLGDFNSNDDEAAISKWYTEDCVIERHPMSTLYNRADWIADNIVIHDGVRETLTLHRYVQQGDTIAAEVTTRFDAERDRPDHISGPLSAGCSRSIHLFVFYTLRDGKICNLRLAGWPAEEHGPATGAGRV